MVYTKTLHKKLAAPRLFSNVPLIGQNTVGQTAAGLTVQMAGEAVWALKKVDLRFLQYEVACVRQQLWTWLYK